MIEKTRRIPAAWFHVIAWACIGLLLLMRVSSWSDTQQTPWEGSMSWPLYTVLVAFAVFYMNYLVLAPRLLLRKRTLLFIGAGLLLLIVGMKGLGVIWQGRSAGEVPPGGAVPFGARLLLFLAFAWSTGLRIAGAWRAANRERDQLALENTRNELQALRSRFDPHFLFNALNAVHALAERKDERTPEVVMQLSLLLRHVLDRSNDERIPLEEELEHLRAYMAIQQLRSNTVRTSLHASGPIAGARVAPLLLMPLVENAFKHGTSTDEASPVDVLVSVTEDVVRVQVSNRDHGQHARNERTGGQGLVDLQRRLQLLYPGKHELTSSVQDEVYRATLTLRAE